MDLPRLTPRLLFRRTLRNIRGGTTGAIRSGGYQLLAGSTITGQVRRWASWAAEPFSRRCRSIRDDAEACPNRLIIFGRKIRIWNGGPGNS